MLLTAARRKFAIICLLLAVACLRANARSSKQAQISWQPASLVRGSPVLFQVSAPSGVQAITATWLGHSVVFSQTENGKLWYALAGIPVETSAGIYDLTVTEKLAYGTAHTVWKVKVLSASYPKIPIRVAKQFTEPDPEQVKQIAADKGVKQAVFATDNPNRLWTGQFQAPVSAAISDVFGTERVINQQVQSRHLGLDYAAPAGTPVRAINRGKVILARPLFFEGSCVVIDHGQGLLSLYLHLSEFQTKEGDSVEAGQVIGLSGGSGRATGPHLHLAVRWQGVYVNPATLLKIEIP